MEHWFILPVATQGQITKGFFFLFVFYFLLEWGFTFAIVTNALWQVTAE